MMQSLPDISEPFRDRLIYEFSEMKNGDHALCPNVTSFHVLGGLRGSNFLQLKITHTEENHEEHKEHLFKDTFIVVYDISMVFEPQEYLEHGF